MLQDFHSDHRHRTVIGDLANRETQRPKFGGLVRRGHRAVNPFTQHFVNRQLSRLSALAIRFRQSDGWRKRRRRQSIPQILPSSKPCCNVRLSNQDAARPVMTAVIRTPTVASTIAGFQAIRIADSCVLYPPSNRIIARASVPIPCARSQFSNAIPPIPSEPANIPSNRKSTRTGTSKRVDSSLEMIPRNSRMPATRISWSTRNIKLA